MGAYLTMSFSVLQIESNEIFATIDHSNGMVSFHVNPEKYNGPLMANHIDEEVSNTLTVCCCQSHGFVFLLHR